MYSLRSFRLLAIGLPLLLLQQLSPARAYTYTTHPTEPSSSTLSTPLTAPTHGKVISVTDGDTLTVLCADGVPEKIRLVDIDAPEKTQPFGTAAKHFLSDLAYMHSVTISRRGHDRYGRTLATVTVSDAPSSVNVNAALLDAGYAWIYRGKTKETAYYDLESSARTAHRGLWSDPTAVAPWDFRKAAKARHQQHLQFN